MKKKLTVKEILDSKGKKKLTQVYVHTPLEANACEKSGIDMNVSSENNNFKFLRDNAKNTFDTNDFDKNTWQSPQILRYLNNDDGEKIITHSWNNVVKWGDKSNKQPFSHLVVLHVDNLNSLFSSNSEIKSKHLMVF